jgi:hypothetical protein
MDEGKILIVNLSRGQIGEDNAGVLGALMVTKIQLAAMSRANIPMEQRRPFYLYVDEFQNFATDSFATILSEARKYALNLTVANQYISQMPEEVRDAVFGNVGSIVTFRVGAEDAQKLGKYFAPTFEPDDLIKLNNQHILVNMSIDGEKALPFSAKTLRMPDPEQDFTPQLTAASRQHYASQRTEVERDIAEWTLGQSAGEKPTSEQDALAAADEQKPNEFLRGLKNPAAHERRTPVRSGGGAGRGTGGGRSGGARPVGAGAGQRGHGNQSGYGGGHSARSHHPGGGSQAHIAAGQAVSLRPEPAAEES